MKYKNKVDIFFNNITDITTSFIQGILFLVWNILSTIIRSPLFWLLVILWVMYYIGTHPVQPIEYCPSCHQQNVCKIK